MKNSTLLLIAVVILLVVAVIAGISYLGNLGSKININGYINTTTTNATDEYAPINNATITPPTTTATTTAEATTTVTTGRNLKIGFINMTKPGFIVIRNQAGNIIGISTYLKQGASTGVTIGLNNNVSIGDKLSAYFYHDNGDSTFQENQDTLVKDQAGKTAVTEFNVNSNLLLP